MNFVFDEDHWNRRSVYTSAPASRSELLDFVLFLAINSIVLAEEPSLYALSDNILRFGV